MSNVTNRLISSGFSGDEADILYGQYGLYKVLIGVPMVVIIAISATLFPAISGSRVLGDKKAIRSKIRHSLRLVMVVSVPAVIGLMSVSDTITKCLFGFDVKVTTNLLILGSFILILMAITTIQTSVLQGMNKFYYIIFTFSIGIALKIVLNYIFVSIKEINIYGVLIGNMFWYLVPTIMNHRMIVKITKIKISYIRIIFKPLVASMAMATVIYIISIPFKFSYTFIGETKMINALLTLIDIIVGGFIYGYIMVVIGGIKRKDIESISPRIIGMLPRFIRKKLR